MAKDLRESAERGLTNGLHYRYTRSALRKSRTLASGSATTRAQAPTTCTRSIGRCRGRRQWMLFTKTWPQDIEPALGQFTYGSHHLPKDLCGVLTYFLTTDPQGRRAREDGRCEASLHQTTTLQEPQISSSSPCAQSYQQSSVFPSPTCHVCLGDGQKTEGKVEPR